MKYTPDGQRYLDMDRYRHLLADGCDKDKILDKVVTKLLLWLNKNPDYVREGRILHFPSLVHVVYAEKDITPFIQGDVCLVCRYPLLLHGTSYREGYRLVTDDSRRARRNYFSDTTHRKILWVQHHNDRYYPPTGTFVHETQMWGHLHFHEFDNSFKFYVYGEIEGLSRQEWEICKATHNLHDKLVDLYTTEKEQFARYRLLGMCAPLGDFIFGDGVRPIISYRAIAVLYLVSILRAPPEGDDWTENLDSTYADLLLDHFNVLQIYTRAITKNQFLIDSSIILDMTEEDIQKLPYAIVKADLLGNPQLT
jgi:hypothetical protein